MENKTVKLDAAEAREAFSKLENNPEGFFKHVADDVDWIVQGHHPLAGHFHTKQDFRAATLEKLAKVLPEGVSFKLTHFFVSGDWSIAELEANTKALNGLLFDNHYCWLARWANGKIVEVRAYLDSALIKRLFEENPI